MPPSFPFTNDVPSSGSPAATRIRSCSPQSPPRLRVGNGLDRIAHRIFFFYALSALSVIASIVPIKWPKTSAPLVIGTILLGVIVLGMSGYIAYAGGKIRHKEFRTEPPPKKPASSPG